MKPEHARPDYFDTEVPADVERLAARYSKEPDRLTAQHKGWLVVHDPGVGTQRICLIVKTVHLPTR